MRTLSFFLLLFHWGALEAQEELKTLNFAQLQHQLQTSGDTVHVINFWATWCGPCVTELPLFEALATVTKGPPLKVTLVSLDFKNQVESKLIPFVRDRKIQSDVLHLYERSPNEWIDKVSKEWSGAIPATLFVHGDRELFHEGSFSSKQEILEKINSLYNSKS